MNVALLDIGPALSGPCCFTEEVLDDVRGRCLPDARQRGIDLRLGGDLSLRIPMPLVAATDGLMRLVRTALESTPCGGRVTVVALELPDGKPQLRVSVRWPRRPEPGLARISAGPKGA